MVLIEKRGLRQAGYGFVFMGRDVRRGALSRGGYGTSIERLSEIFTGEFDPGADAWSKAQFENIAECRPVSAPGSSRFFWGVCLQPVLFYGLHFISSSRASLIVALNPALIALTAFAISRERLRPVNLAGIVLCIAGASTVIISKGTGSIASVSGAWRGDVLILGCVMSWVIYSVFARRLVREIGPLHTVAYSVMAGTLMLFIAAIVQGDLNLPALSHIQQTQWLSLIYLGVLGSALAYIWYYDGIQNRRYPVRFIYCLKSVIGGGVGNAGPRRASEPGDGAGWRAGHYGDCAVQSQSKACLTGGQH